MAASLQRPLFGLLMLSAAADAVPLSRYIELSAPCKDANPISGLLPVASVAACEEQCDKQAASAPGTGQAACAAVDTDGKKCYLKSVCGGTAGSCQPGQMCGYRRQGAIPPTPAPPAPPVPPSPPGVTLRGAAAPHGIFIGAATNVAGLESTTEPQYKSVEQAQFSLTTAENACKVGPIHPQRDHYDWSGCDTVFAAAEAANQSVRGHNLCWHTENPGWLTNGNFTPPELSTILQEHITTVVGHYGNRAYCWDVVNEALDDHGLKPSFPWYPALPNYLDIAFHAARKAAITAVGPAKGLDIKLFYNDYSAEGMNAKSDQVYELVKSMKQRNVPIDGVGLQFHWDLHAHTDLQDVAANMKRLGDLGLEVHITELDIKCVPKGSKKACTQELLNAQAQLYADILTTCIHAPACKSFESWGFTDKHTWIGTQTHPLPFDENYKAKPAVAAMINAMLANTTSL